MKDWSNGKYYGLAVIHTKKGFNVAEVDRRLSGGEVTITRQADTFPTRRLAPAMALLVEVRQSQLGGLGL